MDAVKFEFPLLELPFLALELVLLNIPICELLHFSFVSKKCKWIVKHVKPLLEGLTVVVNSQCTSVHFVIDDEHNGAWYFDFAGNREQVLECSVTAVLDGIEFRSLRKAQRAKKKYNKFCSEGLENVIYGIRIKNNKLFSDSNADVRDCLEAGIQYLIQFFGYPVVSIVFETDDLPKSRYPLMRKYYDSKRLKIAGKQEIDEEELKRIIDSTNASQRVLIDIPFKQDFQWNIQNWRQKPRHIHIWKDAHWITSEMLFNLKCSRLLFFDCRLTANDCREYVKRWYHSTDITFKSLFLTWKNEIPEGLNCDGIGIELMEFDPKNRNAVHRYYGRRAYDLSHGIDFLRSDGLLATFAVFSKAFVFCVWHKRFPSVDRLYPLN